MPLARLAFFAVVRVLAYGFVGDLVDEYMHMIESTNPWHNVQNL
jgi:hypothetical protein